MAWDGRDLTDHLTPTPNTNNSFNMLWINFECNKYGGFIRTIAITINHLNTFELLTLRYL